MNADELLQDLTEAQRSAVRHVDGPLLIIAGAGSGKTRVITRRVGYLVNQGIPASSILAITFTNKAAGEMKERIGKVIGRNLRDFGRLDQSWPTICTFHSLCLRILRHYAAMIGLPANFTIYDSGDQTKLIKEAMKVLEIDSANFSPGTVHGTISNAKNQLQTAADFSARASDFYARTVARIYKKYQAMLALNNALDFDDLLLRTAHCLRDFPQMLAELQERFQYLLIDEYQDTNHAQYVLAHALALRHRNICVVGDPDQSIYAWRGADIQNILDFEKDYPDATVVKLEQNYRSTRTILQLASSLIANNKQRKEKALWTENAQGEKARLFVCQDEYDEAEVIAKELKHVHDQHGLAWHDMAIFYRMNSLSRVMEDALRKKNIPYVMARGVEFYNRREIKDVLAYLRAIANPSDEVSLTRIINTPSRGISDNTVKQLQSHAIAQGLSLWQMLESAGKVSGLTSRAANSIKAFAALVNEWRSRAGSTSSGISPDAAVGSGGDLIFDEASATSAQAVNTAEVETGDLPDFLPDEPPAGTEASGKENPPIEKGPVQTLMEDVIRRSGLQAYYRKEGGDELAELANLDQLINSAAEFDRENADGTLDEYLSAVALVSDTDHMKGNGGAITMMTLHAAKGLEFPTVAIMGLEEGCLPHARARTDPDQLEEERRLFFVGITRAQERLIISRAQYRTVRGLRERTMNSPFLNELSATELEVTDRTGVAGRSGYEFRDPPAYSSRAGRSFRRGQMVRHPTFGLGRIADLNGMGSGTRVVVEFTQAGRKTLVLEHARLEAVG